MNNFIIYLQLGLGHILNIAAIDHLLFILSFTAGMNFKDYKKSFYYVTAFSVGHSITLALATLKIVVINVSWIEFLIPITIILSSLSLLQESSKQNTWIKFILIAIFGLIHGLGFSNYLQSLLGQEQSILVPLLGFNLGVEIAQIFVVCLILTVMWLLLQQFKINQKWVLWIIISMILLFSVPMVIERIP